MASTCGKYSALQRGPNGTILPWKSNTHPHARSRTCTHTHIHGTLNNCQKPFPWTNDDLWEAALFPAFLLLYFRSLYPDHVFLLSLTHSKQAFCFPCTGERSSLQKEEEIKKKENASPSAHVFPGCLEERSLFTHWEPWGLPPPHPHPGSLKSCSHGQMLRCANRHPVFHRNTPLQARRKLEGMKGGPQWPGGSSDSLNTFCPLNGSPPCLRCSPSQGWSLTSLRDSAEMTPPSSHLPARLPRPSKVSPDFYPSTLFLLWQWSHDIIMTFSSLWFCFFLSFGLEVGKWWPLDPILFTAWFCN